MIREPQNSTVRRFRSVVVVLSGLAVLAAVAALTFLFFASGGCCGWNPSATSTSSLRAHGIDSELRIGMSVDDVKSRFAKDVADFSSDSFARAYPNARPGIPNLPAELDLFVFDRRPHPWNTFDYSWTVRTGFDSQGKLMKHEVVSEPANGP